MECTIITYGSAHNFILHAMTKYGLVSRDVVIKEYCNGEVLKEKISNRNRYGNFKINIAYPTYEKNELKKLVGRSAIVYCDRLLNREDKETITDNFAYMFKDRNYSSVQLFNMSTLTVENIVLPKVTEEDHKIKTKSYQLMSSLAYYIESTTFHASMEFNEYPRVE